MRKKSKDKQSHLLIHVSINQRHPWMIKILVLNGTLSHFHGTIKFESRIFNGLFFRTEFDMNINSFDTRGMVLCYHWLQSCQYRRNNILHSREYSWPAVFISVKSLIIARCFLEIQTMEFPIDIQLKISWRMKCRSHFLK